MLDMIDMCMEEFSIVDHILPKKYVDCPYQITRVRWRISYPQTHRELPKAQRAQRVRHHFGEAFLFPNDRNSQLVDFESIYIAPLVVLHLYSKGSSEDQSGAFWMFLSQVSGCFLMFPSTKMFP